MTTYAITGATGGLGGHAVRTLIERGVAASDIVAVVRNPSRAEDLAALGVQIRVADYTDRPALEVALAGVDKLLLVSGSEPGVRVSQHANVIEAAKTTGVGLLAYTSLLAADTSELLLAADHQETEKLLAASGVPFILLRNGWYWENLAASAPAAIAGGVLYGASGDGKVSGASRDDYAEAAAVALISAAPGTIFELAGDDIDYPAIAATIGQAAGTTVRYQNMSEADYASALGKAGLPAPLAAIFANSSAGTAQGWLASSSTQLTELIGRPAASLADVLTLVLASA